MGKCEVLVTFDPFWFNWIVVCCLWLLLHVAMTLWYVSWLIRIVKLLENVVEWRRKLAGKLQKCAGSEPVRIGERGRIGLGNWPRESELDGDLPLEEVWQEGRPLLRVGVGQEIGSERWSGSDRSKLGNGADRIGRVIGGQIGSTWRCRARIGSKEEIS